MQLSLRFAFVHERDVVVCDVDVAVPLPRQRPRMVANVVYMVTGELPPPALLHALGLDDHNNNNNNKGSGALLAYSDAAAARAAGLRPLRDAAVVRIDTQQMLLEMGSSTTHTIFGGFIADEPLPATTPPPDDADAAHVTHMRQLRAGTVLCANLGVPNSNASRYYILLRDVVQQQHKNIDEDDADGDELRGFLPVGVVTSGLHALQHAALHTAVHPRTLAPRQKVTLLACRVHVDYAKLSAARVAAQQTATATTTTTADTQQRHNGGAEVTATATCTRLAGRVRTRDEADADEAQSNTHDESNSSNNSSSHRPRATHGGFFSFAATYPGPRRGRRSGHGDDAAAAMRASKRRRLDDNDDNDNGDNEGTAHDAMARAPQDGHAFDLFAAQAHVFAADLAHVRDTQALRVQHRQRRAHKAAAHTRGTRDSARRRSDGEGAAAGAAASGGARRGKQLRRRY